MQQPSQLSQATGLNAARTHLDISWLYMVECDELQRQRAPVLLAN